MVKIDKMTFGATIPTGQYANLQPSIELSDITDKKEAEQIGMDYIKDLYKKYSSIGELKENGSVGSVVVSKKV